MKCPFKLSPWKFNTPYDATLDDQCDSDCAWRIKCFGDTLCAVAVIAVGTIFEHPKRVDGDTNE